MNVEAVLIHFSFYIWTRSLAAHLPTDCSFERAPMLLAFHIIIIFARHISLDLWAHKKSRTTRCFVIIIIIIDVVDNIPSTVIPFLVDAAAAASSTTTIATIFVSTDVVKL